MLTRLFRVDRADEPAAGEALLRAQLGALYAELGTATIAERAPAVAGDAVWRHFLSVPLPPADMWLCRDTLAHLPDLDIVRTLKAVCDSTMKYALISTMPEIASNEDAAYPGCFRRINLAAAPYCFPAPLRSFVDVAADGAPCQLALWSREQIREAIQANNW
jgi:hypothetical protein